MLFPLHWNSDHCPSLGDQHSCVVLRQLDEVTHGVAPQLNAVDGVRELAGKPNEHLPSQVRRRWGAGRPFSVCADEISGNRSLRHHLMQAPHRTVSYLTNRDIL